MSLVFPSIAWQSQKLAHQSLIVQSLKIAYCSTRDKFSLSGNQTLYTCLALEDKSIQQRWHYRIADNGMNDDHILSKSLFGHTVRNDYSVLPFFQ